MTDMTGFMTPYSGPDFNFLASHYDPSGLKAALEQAKQPLDTTPMIDSGYGAMIGVPGGDLGSPVPNANNPMAGLDAKSLELLKSMMPQQRQQLPFVGGGGGAARPQQLQFQNIGAGGAGAPPGVGTSPSLAQILQGRG